MPAIAAAAFRHGRDESRLNPCAVGPMSMGNPSSPVAGPTAAGRRFAFRVTLGEPGQPRVRRRHDVADYLDGWVPLRVVSQQVVGRHCWLWVETQRRVAEAAAADFANECPGYVRKSFRMLG